MVKQKEKVRKSHQLVQILNDNPETLEDHSVGFSPEQRLLLAIVERCLFDLRKPYYVVRFRSAKKWVRSKDKSFPSLIYICSEMDLDYKTVVEYLRSEYSI